MNDFLYKSPLGILKIIAVDNKVTSISFLHSQSEKQKKPNHFISTVIQKLDAYFEDYHKPLDFEMNLEGTAFQKKIWRLLLAIPVGTTVSYYKLAQTYGNVKAIRAIGAAIGKNPIAIAIPCHRVIGSDGNLVGYAGGLDKKKALLEHENVLIQKSLDL